MKRGSTFDLTVVAKDGRVLRAETYRRLAIPSGPCAFHWRTAIGEAGIVDTDDEGVTWVRGFHDDDAPIVLAMRTTHALRAR